MQNDLAKQKINLARLTGLPPSDGFDLTDDIPFTPAPAITLEDALEQARDQRPDLKGAQAQVRAAERAFVAARAERFPSDFQRRLWGDQADAHSVQTVE